MTIDPRELRPAFEFLLAAGVVCACAGYLGRARFLSIWESEGVLSWRLLAATAILAFVLYMLAAGRLTISDAKDLLQVTVELAFLGTIKVIASRFAPKPTIDPTQQPKPDDQSTT